MKDVRGHMTSSIHASWCGQRRRMNCFYINSLKRCLKTFKPPHALSVHLPQSESSCELWIMAKTSDDVSLINLFFLGYNL